MSPLIVHLRRNNEASEGDLGKVLPASPLRLSYLETHHLASAYRAVSGNKLHDAEHEFRSLLHMLVLTPALNELEAQRILELIGECREYLIGISIELERRALAADAAQANEPAQVARIVELAALFTHVQMQPQHQMLALRIAMMEARRVGNLAMAGHFARRLIELQPPAKVVQVAQQIVSLSDRQPRDAVQVSSYLSLIHI